MLGAFVVARSLPLLRVLGADARPDVRDDRHLGRHEPHQGGAQVLPLHDGRLDADARRHPVPRVHVREAHRARRSFDYFALSARACCRAHVADAAASGRFAIAVLHQGPDVAGAHVAARRARAGADGRLGHPGRRHAEARAPTGTCASAWASSPGAARVSRPTSPASPCSAASSTARSCAWKQDDVKRLVAYSSVAHLGYVMLGLFAATPVVDRRAPSCRW